MMGVEYYLTISGAMLSLGVSFNITRQLIVGEIAASEIGSLFGTCLVRLGLSITSACNKKLASSDPFQGVERVSSQMDLILDSRFDECNRLLEPLHGYLLANGQRAASSHESPQAHHACHLERSRRRMFMGSNRRINPSTEYRKKANANTTPLCHRADIFSLERWARRKRKQDGDRAFRKCTLEMI